MSTPAGVEERIFHLAREIPDLEARRAYLQEACGDNAELRARVDALLRIHDDERSFLDRLAKGFGRTGDTPIAERPGTQIGPYKLIEQIGEGGFGVVFMAEQQQPIRRKVALKVLKPGMDTGQVVARFEAERQALALMEHPNIAHVLDGGQTATGRPYFVMELVKGIPITTYCDEHHLSPRERLALFIPVCEAVQHAHQKGIIHRDLKPSNVLIASYDGRPAPKVIDFGVAKAMGQQLTERTLVTSFGGIVGTLEYMSPEQAEFNALDIDTRADIYCLGVMLYELLTGTTPLTKQRLKEAAITEVLRLIREEEPPTPSTRLSDSKESLASISAQRKLEPARLTKTVRGELDWIVMKCLEKNRTRRYETANGLARDIQRYLNEEIVEARPPSASYKFRKFSRKYRRLLWTVGAFALLLVVATAISTWQAVRATLAERETAKERDKADEQAAIAEAVNDFLNNDLLFQAAPESSPDRDMKLREVLDRASKAIEGRFLDRPLVEARIRLTLGKTYRSLGDHATAERHCLRARQLYLQTVGPDHRFTLTATNDLAGVYFYQGRPKDARPLLESVVDSQRRVLGLDHKDTLRSQYNLAGVLFVLQELNEAKALQEKTLERQRAVLGSDHADTLISISNLARIFRAMGRLDNARGLLEETRDIQRRLYGPDNPNTMSTEMALSNVLQLQDRPEEALRIDQDLLQRHRRVYGPEHHFTASGVHNIARSLVKLGRIKEAREHFEEAFTIHRRTMGPAHPETLNIMRGFIWLLATAEDATLRDSQRAFDLAQELIKHEPKEDRSFITLGVAAYRVGDWRTAITELEHAAPLVTAKELCRTNFFLAMAYWQVGEKDKARERHGQAAQWMDKHLPKDKELIRFRDEAKKLMIRDDS